LASSALRRAEAPAIGWVIKNEAAFIRGWTVGWSPARRSQTGA